MKVIFVASGNKKGAGQVNSFVQSQLDSLQAEGLEMLLFPVKGKGWKGYARAVVRLRKLVEQEKPDIIHAHYSTCGFVASLATMCMRRKPKIMVSILGSFPTRNGKWRIVRWAIRHLWNGALVKSERTKRQLGLDVPVIPNGVNLEIFEENSKVESRKSIGWDENTKYVIWCSNPERPEKDWALAQAAVEILNDKSQMTHATLVAVFDKTPQEVCTYMNAADCLLLTSVSEGSPNVIKEAMACNCPIVTTNVGDVNERLEKLDGCFVVDSREPMELTEALKNALAFGKRTEGRKRIIADQLEISQIAKRIIKIYERI